MLLVILKSVDVVAFSHLLIHAIDPRGQAFIASSLVQPIQVLVVNHLLRIVGFKHKVRVLIGVFSYINHAQVVLLLPLLAA